MRPIMPFTLIVIAWCCYFISLFCPAVSVETMFSPDGDTIAEEYTGFDCLVQSLILGIVPYFGIRCFPYAVINFCMYLSPLYWTISSDKTRRRFTGVLSVCFLISLTVPFTVEQVFSGFIFWSMAFCLTTLAFLISLPHWSSNAVIHDKSLNQSGV